MKGEKSSREGFNLKARYSRLLKKTTLLREGKRDG